MARREAVTFCKFAFALACQKVNADGIFRQVFLRWVKSASPIRDDVVFQAPEETRLHEALRPLPPRYRSVISTMLSAAKDK